MSTETQFNTSLDLTYINSEVQIGFLDNNGAVEPSKANLSDSGFDIVATSCKEYEKNSEILVYGTSLKVQIPSGYELQLRPRSSIRNYDLMLVNSPGTIDEQYTGEISVCFRKMPRPDGTIRTYSVGDKIAQLILAPVIQAKFVPIKELKKTDRGEKGFGSSGI